MIISDKLVLLPFLIFKNNSSNFLGWNDVKVIFDTLSFNHHALRIYINVSWSIYRNILIDIRRSLSLRSIRCHLFTSVMYYDFMVKSFGKCKESFSLWKNALFFKVLFSFVIVLYLHLKLRLVFFKLHKTKTCYLV